MEDDIINDIGRSSYWNVRIVDWEVEDDDEIDEGFVSGDFDDDVDFEVF